MWSNMFGYMFMHSLFLVLCLFHILVTNSVLSVQPLCHEDERLALLRFKHSFSIKKLASDDPSAYPKMESWKLEHEHGDCCSWDGIECDEITGHVTGLDISSSFIYGSISSSSILFRLLHLRRLNLADNYFNYSEIPSAIGGLSRLTTLNLSNAKFSGEFPRCIFLLPKLQLLSGLIPTWLWNSSKETMTTFQAHDNLLTGFEKHPTVIPWQNMASLNLNSNRLRGSLPIPPKSTVFYATRGNTLTGEIPPSICNNDFLQLLDLSDNNLSGRIPPCLATVASSLLLLNLSSNSFHGIIPEMFSMSINLKMIDLSQNQLYGKVPRSMANCTKLEVLNLGNNYIDDSFPVWLETLPELKVLVLRNNKFYGGIENLTINAKFSKLQIIDLSCNNFSGNLPLDYFRKWEAMKIAHKDELEYMIVTAEINSSQQLFLKFKYHWPYTFFATYTYSITIINKGTQLDYGKIRVAFVSINLSSNRFKGQIPEFLKNLKGLQSLNLSNNEFDGPIPSSLGNLKELESLDLSQNLLSGKIPHQLTYNTFLAVFNVSYNNLVGPIPQGSQFDTFENSSYEGNPGLCGKPLSKPCGSLEPSSPPPSTLQQDKNSEFSSTIDWVVRILGYGSGVIVGLVLGQVLTTRNHYWFVKTFGRR